MSTIKSITIFFDHFHNNYEQNQKTGTQNVTFMVWTRFCNVIDFNGLTASFDVNKMIYADQIEQKKQ